MSLKGIAGGRESPRASHFITQTSGLFAGFAASIMTVAYGLSFAALIFSASLHTWLARYRGHLYHHGHRRIVCGGKELSPLCHSRS